MDDTSNGAEAFGGADTIYSSDSFLTSLLEEDSEKYGAQNSMQTSDSGFDLYSGGNDTYLIDNAQSQTIASTSTFTTTTTENAQTYTSMQTVDQLGCGCGACSGTGAALQTAGNDGGSYLTDNGATAYDGDTFGGEADSGKPTATPEQFADYLVNGYWEAVGWFGHSWAQSNVTYSISNEFTAGQKEGIRWGFQQWQDVADITFTEVGSGGMIDVREGDDGRAFASGNSNGSGDITSMYISIDTNIGGWDIFNDIGYYGLKTVIHEIGHAIGLGHSGNYNGSADYTADAIWANDTRQYSTMSYFQASYSGADHNGGLGTQYGSTPLLYDILAIQSIYGTNNTTRSGDTVYGWNSTAGREQFNFAIHSDPVVAIWDGGGTDTIDLSGFGTSQMLNLNDGEFSNVGIGMTGNLSIAFGAVIENAIGGSGADTIYGNEANNVILGGNGNDVLFASAGDDTLNGQAGDDTVNYNFSVTALAFQFIDSVTVTIEHLAQSWTDLVSNIENFIFSDGTYTFAELEDAFGEHENLVAPEVTADNFSIEMGSNILASSVIEATDADGDEITYIIMDSSQGATSGYFSLGGTILAANVEHTLTQAEFDSLRIYAGTSGGTDQLRIKVSDGEHTTSWHNFSMTTTASGGANDHTPTVTASALTLNQNQHVLASTIITGNDADGNIITYEVWDSSGGGTTGYFDLNGAKLASGKGHILTQAQFDALEIVGGSANGSDSLWVRVSDGEKTSGWKNFKLTTDGVGGGGGGVQETTPTVNSSDLTLDAGTSVLASTVISGDDLDGDALTYIVWDGSNDTTSGYFDLNGTQLQGGINHSLTEAEFAALRIFGGSADGSETMYVRVSDGDNMTAWDSFTLTTQNAVGTAGGGATPVLTSQALTLNIDQNVLASTVITGTDNEGDAITYEVWDSTAAGTSGYFDLNGTRLASGQGHSLTEAEFANLRIVGGDAAGTDKLWVRASDGNTTSAWQTFTLTTQSGGGGGGGGGGGAMSVTANDLAIGTDEQVLASTAITATGSNLTYIVWDGGSAANSGYFDLNGTRLQHGRSHNLTEAEFSNLLIVGGSTNGTETLWVKVNDGQAQTAWKSFILTSNDALGDIIDSGDDAAMAQAMEDISGGQSASQQAADSQLGGDVFSGVNGFEEDNGASLVI